MELNLPEPFVKRVMQYVDPEHGVTTLDVLEKAMDHYENNHHKHQYSAEEMKDLFRDLRGTLDATLDEIIAAKHIGAA